MAGCRSKTEAEILKDSLSSTQLMGFLSYGESSFDRLLQEPYHYNFSCWGLTLRSTKGRSEGRKRRNELGIKAWIRGQSD